jgi:hypothetical protein
MGGHERFFEAGNLGRHFCGLDPALDGLPALICKKLGFAHGDSGGNPDPLEGDFTFCVRYVHAA